MQHFQESTLIPMPASSILEAFYASGGKPTTQILDRLDPVPPILFSRPSFYASESLLCR